MDMVTDLSQLPQDAPMGPGSLGAQSTHDLRGNYENARADFTIDQDLAAYTATDRAVWRVLFERQRELVLNYAAPEFVEGLHTLGDLGEIPNLKATSTTIADKTGWRLVAVPGFIPDQVFFEHLANRRFPVCTWVRKVSELDYLVEPDLFHDFFGHVPLLLNRSFADYLQLYGIRAQEALDLGALSRVARLYWYMVEFGLIETNAGLKAYGAGMLSSKAETVYSVCDNRPNRVRFQRDRVMRSGYLIDDFQKTYFVIRSFDELFDSLNYNSEELFDRLATQPDLDPALILATDELVPVTALN